MCCSAECHSVECHSTIGRFWMIPTKVDNWKRGKKYWRKNVCQRKKNFLLHILPWLLHSIPSGIDKSKITYSNTELMRLFHPAKNLVFSRNMWLILLSKFWLFLNLVKHASKNSKDSKYVLIFSLASVAVECLVNLWFFTK